MDGEAREEGCDCAHKAEPGPEERVELDVGAAPVRGPADAPVTIVIFSDFECPFCARVEATLRTLDEEHRGKLRFAFKNYPLPFHEHARLAAKAALAAGEQGRFWEYHDALFARQSALDPASLERVASELRLDVARFRAALASDRIESAVASDAAEATKLGVQGTPTFFVNGKRLVGARSIEDFRAAVDEALKGERR